MVKTTGKKKMNEFKGISIFLNEMFLASQTFELQTDGA